MSEMSGAEAMIPLNTPNPAHPPIMTTARKHTSSVLKNITVNFLRTNDAVEVSCFSFRATPLFP